MDHGVIFLKQLGFRSLSMHTVRALVHPIIVLFSVSSTLKFFIPNILFLHNDNLNPSSHLPTPL